MLMQKHLILTAGLVVILAIKTAMVWIMFHGLGLSVDALTCFMIYGVCRMLWADPKSLYDFGHEELERLNRFTDKGTSDE